MNTKFLILLFFLVSLLNTACARPPKPMKKVASEPSKSIRMKSLSPEEKAVILEKGTERPYSGIFEKYQGQGTYLCKQCHTPLYRSEDKFDAGCGWPSFDDELPGAILRIPDADGQRTEIVCASCKGHLGHVFTGEGFTDNNVRHCVNSISLEFSYETVETLQKRESAIFAGGCFWGVEHLMQRNPGVVSVVSGYIGGHKDFPTYQEVCSHTTGHAEAVQVIFDPEKTDYETLARLFFEIHNPEQTDGQGPDLGPQYRSEIFYTNQQQKVVAEKLIAILMAKGYRIATKVTPATTFWEAEDYHQDYYEHKGSQPYCHAYIKRF